MNTILLEKVRDKIKAEPRQFNMDSFFDRELPNGQAPANCGTAACIAGWAKAIALGVTPKEAESYESILWHDQHAQLFLGLNGAQSDRLFYEDNWPKQFQSTRRASLETKARKAVARINHFMKTKGRE